MKNFEDINRLQILAIGFPSPCGEMGMKNIKSSASDVASDVAFPSPCGEMGMKNYSDANPLASGRGRFPSPCGEMGMKNKVPLCPSMD